MKKLLPLLLLWSCQAFAQLGSGGVSQIQIPAGGTTGQALTKNSGSDYDMIWGNAAFDVTGNYNWTGTNNFNTAISLPGTYTKGNAGQNAITMTSTLTGSENNAEYGAMDFQLLPGAFTNSFGSSLVNVAKFVDTVNNAAAIGGFSGIEAVVNIAGTTGNNTGSGGFYAAGSFISKSNVNDNGTGLTAANARGELFGINPNVQLNNGATNWTQIVGQEIDLAVATGASVLDKVGLQIGLTPSDAVQGTRDNIALALQSATGSSHWQTALSFGDYNSYSPVSSTGTLIGCEAHAGSGSCGTTLNGIDLSNEVFTGSAYKSTGFSVDGSGNVTANSVAGPGGGKTPYTLGQSALPFILPGSGSMGNNGALSGIPATAATVTNGYIFAYPGTLGNATATSVTISGTAGQFACTCTGLAVGQYIKLSGTYGGTGSITGYADPTYYYISATDGTTVFTIQTTGRAGVTTTAGTPTGITYNAGGGWYFFQGSSTTAGTVFNNLYVSGTPVLQGSPTAFVTTGGGAYVAPVSINWWGPLYTLTGGSLGLNGGLDTNMFFKYTNDANAKTVAIFLSNQIVANSAPTATTSIAVAGHLTNVGSASVQEAWQTQVNSGGSSLVSEQSNGAVNTGSDQNLFLRLTIANVADTLNLQSYSIQVRPN